MICGARKRKSDTDISPVFLQLLPPCPRGHRSRDHFLALTLKVSFNAGTINIFYIILYQASTSDLDGSGTTQSRINVLHLEKHGMWKDVNVGAHYPCKTRHSASLAASYSLFCTSPLRIVFDNAFRLEYSA